MGTGNDGGATKALAQSGKRIDNDDMSRKGMARENPAPSIIIIVCVLS